MMKNQREFLKRYFLPIIFLLIALNYFVKDITDFRNLLVGVLSLFAALGYFLFQQKYIK